MDPKLAPYRCCCHACYWSKNEFYHHLQECPEFKAFKKVTNNIIQEYERLQKTYVNPEDLI